MAIFMITVTLFMLALLLDISINIRRLIKVCQPKG